MVASSEGHDLTRFALVPEEMLTDVTTWPGEPRDKLIRADMVYFEAPNGGAVFSVGSITFCGSLPHNNMMPYLTLNYCIALQGVFPPRT